VDGDTDNASGQTIGTVINYRLMNDL